MDGFPQRPADTNNKRTRRSQGNSQMPSSAALKVAAPPDGGWGWMVLFGAFISYMIADGWSYTFGLFFPIFLRHFGESHSKTAIIGAMIYGVPRLASPFVCALINLHGCRVVAIAGGILTFAAFVASSFATSINFLCLTIGFLASLGFATIFITSVVMVTFYFERRRGLATGLSTTGSGLGAFIFPPLIEICLSYYSWKGTLLLLASVTLHLVVAGALFRPPPMKNVVHLEEKYDPLDDCDTKSADTLPPFDEFSAQNSNKHRNDFLFSNASLRHLQLVSISTWSLTSSSRWLDQTKSYPLEHLTVNTLNKNISPTCVLSGQSSSIDLSQESHDAPLDRRDSQGSGSMKSVSCPDLQVIKNDSDHECKLEKNFPQFDTVTCIQSARLKEIILKISKLWKSTVDMSLFCNPSYIVFLISSFIFYLVVVVPYVYLADHVILLGYTDSDAALLLSIIGISRSLGQVILGCLGDLPQVNSICLYSVSIVATALGTVLFPVSTLYAAQCVACIIFGFGVSCTYVLQMMCVIRMVGLEKATNAFGLFQLIPGIATLTGTPVAGWMYEASGDYTMSFYVSSSLIFLSGILLLPLPVLEKRMERKRNNRCETAAKGPDMS